MKNIFPKAEVELMQLVLFPFKVYVVAFPLILFIVMILVGSAQIDRMPLLLVEDQIHLMVRGYIFSIIILTAGAILSAIFMRNWKLMRSGLIYAGIGLFVVTYFIIPSLAESRS